MKKLLVQLLGIVNSLLRPFGLCIKSTKMPTRSFEEFLDHVSRLGFDIQTVVDIGIARGTPGLYSSLPNARFVLIEPLKEAEPGMKKICSDLNGTYHVVAAGAENTEGTFFVHEDWSGSSFYRQAEGKKLDGEERTVPVRRLDGLLDKDLKGPVLIKIDTQGNELSVIDGLGDRLSEIDMFIIEISLMKFREDIPELADVVRYMEEHGFVAYDILEGHTRLLDNALAQVDIVFVPKDSVLRKDHRFLSDDQLDDYIERTRQVA